MKFSLLMAAFLLTIQIPHNNPNGRWRAETGSMFELSLVGSDLTAAIVPASNPRYISYQVDLKGQEEVNTYKGPGHFVAKMSSGKECRFETEWHIVVVAPDRIIGTTTNVVADSDTCAIRETNLIQIELQRVN